jgi:hypothetical protein
MKITEKYHIKCLWKWAEASSENTDASLKGIRMFAWRRAKSPMVHGALDNEFFSNLGLVSLESTFELTVCIL